MSGLGKTGALLSIDSNAMAVTSSHTLAQRRVAWSICARDGKGKHGLCTISHMSTLSDPGRQPSFCLEATLGDPAEALREVEAAQLKAFFLWMIENAERTAPQAGTLKQYFRGLKMIYKRDTGAMLDDELVADVNAVSNSQILA